MASTGDLQKLEDFVLEEEEVDHPMRYVPIRHVYSSTSPCSNPGGLSKKVKAQRLIAAGPDDIYAADDEKSVKYSAALLVYSRRRKDPEKEPISFFDDISRRKQENEDYTETKKRPRELLQLGCVELSDNSTGGPRLRANGRNVVFSEAKKRRRRFSQEDSSSSAGTSKKWAELTIGDADPSAFVGVKCKVYWPMDDKWYQGSVSRFDPVAGKHTVNYDDGEVEDLVLSEEKVKFHVSYDEMQHLNLKCASPNKEKNGLNYNEMLAFAASFDDCQDLEPGDLVWAKLTGHAMWPAIVVDETKISARRGLKAARATPSIIVQFFGTHDFARITLKQAVPFLNGLLSSLHLKCKQTSFYRSLDEAKVYLSSQELPRRMLQMQKDMNVDAIKGTCEDDPVSGEDLSDNELMPHSSESIRVPIEIGDLCITSLGKIVCHSEHFHSKQYIWPVGYTASRKFISLKDSSAITVFKMEVLRDPKSKGRPLFRVTTDDGEQIDGPNPNYCWREIYKRLGDKRCNGCFVEIEGCDFQKPGSYMFGFSHPQVAQLIQTLPNARSCSKYFESCRDMPAGYRAVRVDWKDLDRCSVCHMDEEYEDNLFLQCDKCRMMVHARCYGETDPLDGVLWLCKLCRPGALEPPPPCCLCPVIGGAMKPTTDGRWAHLTCAMWIPETCLLDVKRMEPIDGLSRINKDRWKLLCGICGVSYGACIQCSNSTCYVAYHPLCARAAGLCVELEDEDKLHLMSLDEDDDQCIRLLSFCKKHRQPSNGRPPCDENPSLPCQSSPSYVPASNPTGCARTEPYNSFGRRGQKEPQVLAAASVKRLFVENRSHLVTGYRQNGLGYDLSCTDSLQNSKLSCTTVVGNSLHASVENVFSMAQKYNIMKATYRKRLAFGKSKIHCFGVFARVTHKAGDMVIEYTGELVRPPIADMREHLIYNSLVGAGTYLFRIDDERVIDATRAGSIAHLINHSCEPNCYSRVISVNGDEHIIIFAKRDISQWEELTYDYRFFSIDEQLACFCGFPKCRKVVNDVEAEEQVAKVRVPISDLIHWKGE